jgi:hypothetical protein
VLGLRGSRGVDVAHETAELRDVAIVIVTARCDRQLSNQPGVPERELQRADGPHAEAEQVGLSHIEQAQELGGVIRHLRITQRTSDVCGAPVGLLLDRDDPTRARERRDHRTKRAVDGGERAVQEHERAAAPVHLVVHVQAVHVGKPTRSGQRCARALRRDRGGHQLLRLDEGAIQDETSAPARQETDRRVCRPQSALDVAAARHVHSVVD